MIQPPADAEQPPPSAGRFSLERLSAAFARLMGAPAPTPTNAAGPPIAVEADDETFAGGDDAPVTPRMIVEGLLFVGDNGGRPLSSREIAAHMRNVEPAEVDALVAELNAVYRQDGAAYEVAAVDGGHRLQLREDLASVRERFRRQVRAARLTPAALEVLAVVAYRQPVAGDEINRLRGSQSYSILAQLVRRKLVSVQRSTDAPRISRYVTTERFNRLFGVASSADLPRSEDLDDA